jgi:UDP-N-acetylmuramate dehydrogenase
MHILENVDLRLYSTMRLGGKARWLAEVSSEDDIPKLIAWTKEKDVPFMMIGAGSNIVWRDEGFEGLIIVNRVIGKKVLSEDGDGATVWLGAGEIWDEAVAWTVDKNLSGIEFLSKIPGYVGAAPVQNIGAYGAEIKDVLIEVEAYDTKTGSFGGILNEACDFSYRGSRFKSSDKGQFMITGIVLKLSKSPPQAPFYESLQNYLTSQAISEYTPETIREAVSEIRKIKLPDPAVAASNGSFFTNPIVDQTKYKQLMGEYPEIKGWPTKDNKVKLAAGWMIEKCGFKDVHDQQTGIGTWPGSALVLVNEHAGSTDDLLAFKKKITDKVQEKFGITLEQEPELLP